MRFTISELIISLLWKLPHAFEKIAREVPLHKKFGVVIPLAKVGDMGGVGD